MTVDSGRTRWQRPGTCVCWEGGGCLVSLVGGREGGVGRGGGFCLWMVGSECSGCMCFVPSLFEVVFSLSDHDDVQVLLVRLKGGR